MKKLSQLNVLIIDDISTIRSLLTKQLKELGIVNINASDSILESWNLIHDLENNPNKSIDIIFCDWNMPKGDGIELLEKLRNSNDQGIKFKHFIMITGAKDKVKLAIDSGAHSIIHKPFNTENLKEKIQLIYRQFFE